VKAETADPSADALAALAKGGEDDGVAGAALKMLQKAAEQRAEAREKAQIEENTKAPAEQSKTSYEAGQTVDARI
jgi:mannose/fructose-specific phosphotransferase system component IIA